METARVRKKRCRIRIGKTIASAVIACGILSSCVGIMGCSTNFLDPTDVGRFSPIPAVNVILEDLGVAPETPSTWEGAEDPRPADVMVIDTDQTLNVGDIILISIYELRSSDQVFTMQAPVTETGHVSIPDVGVIPVEGLTEVQVEEEIEAILKPDIIKEPSVTVTILQSVRTSYAILGNGIAIPGRYPIPRYGMRLAEAIALAGGVSEFNVSFMYVARAVSDQKYQGQAGMSESARSTLSPERLSMPGREMLDAVTPQSPSSGHSALIHHNWQKMPVIASAEMATAPELAGFDLNIGDQAGSLSQGRIEWIFRDGRWVPVKAGQPIPTEPRKSTRPQKLGTIQQEAPADYGWDQIGPEGIEARVIRIPVDKFQSGDPRYNVVVRPGDSIYVPVDVIGEFYIMGNINGPGTIPLTGRPMTLKMAIAAAGGLGPLAWPKRCEVVRRLGKDREETVMVDLEKIFRGEQPDFFVKINDTIIVGTHPTARWRAVLRNAFRATYGFGFVYDRNFADRDFGTHRPIPDWF